MTKSTIKYTLITLISIIIIMSFVVREYNDKSFEDEKYHYYYEQKVEEGPNV